MDGPSIALITREGYKFYMSTRIIDGSNFIKDKIEDLAFEEIPVDVPASTLQKVKEFYEHHEYRDIKSVRKPIKSSNFTTLASEWDNTFFKSLPEEDMSDLLLASNYLQCESLFDYCCAFMASSFKDLTLEEVKKKYDITEDLTPELEETIKKEYAYIFKDLTNDA